VQPVIVHLATQRGITSLRNTKRRGQSLGAKVLPIRYEDICNVTEWPRGIYLFSDLQRATEWQRALALQLHEHLSHTPEGFRLFNHPTKSLRRFQLLRALFEQGFNAFNAYTLDELPNGVRYPVFVRYENQHIGPSTGLLKNEQELESALRKMLLEGHNPDDLIVVEFEDTTAGTGIFRKYGAFRFGDRVYTGHMMASTDWSVKREINDRVLVGQEDLQFVKSNPHADQVMRAFDVANLTWGRIDYGVVDGRIQVWEINDNPKLGSSFFKKTMGRRLARRVSRAIRRSVWREELDKVAIGAFAHFAIDPSNFADRVRTGTVALSTEQVLRLES
jgi:hypothetical protein